MDAADRISPWKCEQQPERRLGLLLESLREEHVLLVLDNLEVLLEEGEGTGRMRAGYQDYGRLLRRVAQTIVDLFGNGIALFLEQGEVVFGSVCELLGEHFARLSDMPPSCRAKALRVFYLLESLTRSLKMIRTLMYKSHTRMLGFA